MVGINVPVPVPMAFYSFGGWKDSLSATPTSTARKESGSTPGPRPSPAGGRTSSTANTIGRTCTSRPPCRCDRALPVVRLLICHDALHLVNASLYGNGAAIITNDGGAAARSRDEIEAGMARINVSASAPTAYYPFGGCKLPVRPHPPPEWRQSRRLPLLPRPGTAGTTLGFAQTV
jgi:hypothetical protein